MIIPFGCTLRGELPRSYALQLNKIALLHYRSLHKTQIDAIEKFLQNRPWQASPALTWKSASSFGSSIVPTEIELPGALASQVNAVVKSQGISVSKFLATVFFWFCTYVYSAEYLELAQLTDQVKH